MTSCVLLAVLTATAVATPVHAGIFTASARDGQIHVRVAKKGLFSAFAHDHDFEVTRWRAVAHVPADHPEAADLDVVLEAGSLRDGEKGLSSGDREKVDAQAASPEVLDAAGHPKITFHAERLELEGGAPGQRLRGTAHGELTLRGQTRPVDLPFEAERAVGGWFVRGRGRLKQSDFGVKPYSGFGGTVAVKDAVELVFALELREEVVSKP